MKNFSPLYKEMCEKANILQSQWEPQNKKLYYCMEKHDYEGLVYDVQLKTIDKPLDEWKKNNSWLPTANDLVRIIRSESNLAHMQLLKLIEDECISKISSLQERDEAGRILTLKFTMGMFYFVWNERKKEWFESKKL